MLWNRKKCVFNTFFVCWLSYFQIVHYRLLLLIVVNALYTAGKEYVTVLRLHDAVADTKLAQVGLSIATSFQFQQLQKLFQNQCTQ